MFKTLGLFPKISRFIVSNSRNFATVLRLLDPPPQSICPLLVAAPSTKIKLHPNSVLLYSYLQITQQASLSEVPTDSSFYSCKINNSDGSVILIDLCHSYYQRTVRRTYKKKENSFTFHQSYLGKSD